MTTANPSAVSSTKQNSAIERTTILFFTWGLCTPCPPGQRNLPETS
jgi:hypothetical protein